jgi:uncharacterized protein (DUF58 family)
VLAVGGTLVHLDELFPLALAAVVLVGGSLVWVRVRSWQVEARHYVSPARVALGGVARVELSVTNTGRRSSPVLAARDPFDGGRRDARFSLSPLGPGRTVAASYHLPTGQRGLFAVGPMEFRLNDPFGLASVSRCSGGRSTLCVHPAFEQLPTLELFGVTSDGTKERASRPIQHGDEFYALREYQVGDDLRRVHWASSARTDRLMIREDQDPTSSRLLLVGDLRSSMHDAASFEQALSVLASLADAGIRGGHSVRMVSTGGADSRWGDEPDHAMAILDLLASANAGAPDATSLRRCIWDCAQGATTVIVTTDRVSHTDLRSPTQATGHGHGSAVVVIERAGTSGPQPFSLPWPAVPVPAGTPFAAAWSRRPAALN